MLQLGLSPQDTRQFSNFSHSSYDEAMVKFGKLKREHHILKPFIKTLEKILTLPGVTRVIPGPIKNKPGRPSVRRITYQYATPTGAKLALHDGSTHQEVFVVSSDCLVLKDFIEALALS